MNTFVRPTTILRLFLIQLAVAGCLTASAAVTFSISPSTISNTYSGFITIQATGLNSHETVVVQRYLDLNSNGLIDSPDWLMLQFQVMDGQGPSLIGGATNINVPFDSNSSTGSITIQLNPAAEGIAQRFVWAIALRSFQPERPSVNRFSLARLAEFGTLRVSLI